jgi:nitrogen fixation NifU-like protein
MTTYGAIVLEHFRRPRNHRRLSSPTVAHDAYNPLCGDRVRLELVIEDDAIVSAAFTANACAICTASASLLTERLAGTRVCDAVAIADDDIIAALESSISDGRRACATLAANAMRQGISEFRTRG